MDAASEPSRLPGVVVHGTPAAGPAPAAAPAATRGHGLSFRELLSDLNPLQYIPGVGAIYRAISGDEGNKTLRFVASLGTSFALGGPLGLALTVAERVTGIDPETIGRRLLSGLLHPHAAPGAGGGGKPASAAPEAMASAGEQVQAPAPATPRAWSAAELSAYGIARDPGGDLAADGVHGADVLNTLELARVYRVPLPSAGGALSASA
jgi:hypothetical protein